MEALNLHPEKDEHIVVSEVSTSCHLHSCGESDGTENRSPARDLGQSIITAHERTNVLTEQTHTAPTPNIAQTPAFFHHPKRKFHTALIGTNSIKASLIVLNSPLTCKSTGRLMQCPATSFSHAFSFGVHCQIFTNVMAV